MPNSALAKSKNVVELFDSTGLPPEVATLGSIRYSASIISGLMVVSDGLIIPVTGLCLYLIHPGWSEAASSTYLTTTLVATFLGILIFYFAGLYAINYRDTFRQQARKHLRVLTVCFLTLIAITFAFKASDEFSRIWVFSWFLASAGLLTCGRWVFNRLINKWSVDGRLTRNVAIIGASDQANRMIRSIRSNDGPWIRIAGIFDDRSDRIPEFVEDCPVVGNLDYLIQEARGSRIDDVLIALPWHAEQRMLAVLKRLRVLPVRVGLCPDTIGFNFPYHSYSQYGGVSVLDVLDKPIDGWNSILKSIEDLVLGSLILLFSLPVMLIVSVLIKIDSPGPVFFRQTRYGFNNRPFEIFKFRSLYVDKQDDSAETLVKSGDSRVTRIGAILRRTSLDELPQIINVLRGDMSIVGPRPHAKGAKAGGKYYPHVVAEYTARYRVKPGITGWAQVSGWRGETDTEEKILKRVECDIYYIEHWSILFDLRIMLKTILAVLRNENAY